jgi:3-phosphoshikimate 1-carboxyvinyltransferase
VDGTLTPPGSKSITNRVFLLAGLAQGDSRIHKPLFSDDTIYMLSSLKYMGFGLSQNAEGTAVLVKGAGGSVPWDSARLYVGNAGTAMRFLAATACLGRGSYILDGDARMRRRPLGDLLDALRSLGAEISFAQAQGFPPLTISGGPLEGGEVTLNAETSSQFLSALLMVGRCMEKGLTVNIPGIVTSRPFVDLTLGTMAQFGVTVESEGYSRFRVEPGGYTGTDLTVEADATAATYFLAAAALTGGRITIQGLGTNSVQGDVGFADLLGRMGCNVHMGPDEISLTSGELRGIDVDLNGMPDTVPTLAVVAALARGKTTIRNVANLRVKESDRLAALAAELTKIGARVEELPDGLVIHPAKTLHGATIETYNDHRIAMSFGVLGLIVPGIVIKNPGCVSKTYPRFFEDLASITPKSPII